LIDIIPNIIIRNNVKESKFLRWNLIINRIIQYKTKKK
jgi:hypothetical protein